jgi:DNA-binding response OmpR family regulator
VADSPSAILLVEHEFSLRKFASTALTRSGFTVLEASGGLEGVVLQTR